MYKPFKAIDEQDRRLFMAGITFSQYAGFRSPRDFCRHTTLMVGDVDTDEMLFFSNTIDQDEKDALEGNVGSLTDYFAATIPAYLHPDSQERATKFFSLENLRASFERGQVADSIEYPCVLEAGTMWIRACYYLEQDDNGHVIATIVLIDVSHVYNTLKYGDLDSGEDD